MENVALNWTAAGIKMSGYDYETGFKSRADCEGVCNDLYNGKNGCVAFEWHQTDLHCVPYNSTNLTPQQFNAALYKLNTYSACMLVPDDAVVQTQVSPGKPQHCGGPARTCSAGESVSSKQRNQIPLLARLTMTPEPDTTNLDGGEANEWLAARWHEWLRVQGSPIR